MLLVLDSRMYKHKAWLRVALPDRPNGSSGWIREDFVRLSTTSWRITVNRAAHTRDGLPRRAQAAQLQGRDRQARRRRRRGGLYAIYEKLPQPDPKGFLGPWALHLTAFSDVLFNYGGGPGRVAIHGRDGTSLADPLGSSRLARLRARGRREHPLDGARRPARHARSDHLTHNPTGERSARALRRCREGW